MVTFYICRHGQSIYNLQERLQGWLDTPLTEDGKLAAIKVSKKIKNIKFSEVYSSDLGRALETAYLVCKSLGMSDAIQLIEQLREIDFGDAAGMTVEQAESKFPEIQRQTNYIVPNGESLEQLQKRVTTWLMGISEIPDRNILLISHDSAINSIYCLIKNLDLGTYNKNHSNAHDFVGRFELKLGKLVNFDLEPAV